MAKQNKTAHSKGQNKIKASRHRYGTMAEITKKEI